MFRANKGNVFALLAQCGWRHEYKTGEYLSTSHVCWVCFWMHPHNVSTYCRHCSYVSLLKYWGGIGGNTTACLIDVFAAAATWRRHLQNDQEPGAWFEAGRGGGWCLYGVCVCQITTCAHSMRWLVYKTETTSEYVFCWFLLYVASLRFSAWDAVCVINSRV